MLDKFTVTDLGKKIFELFAWNSFATICSRGSLLVSNVFVARMVGVSDYGSYLILANTAVTIAVFADCGFGLTVTKYVAEYRQASSEKIGNVIFLLTCAVLISGSIFGFGLFFWAAEVADYLNTPDLKYLIQVVSLQPLLLAAIGLGNGVLTGLEAFKKLAIINFFMSMANFFGLVTAAYFFGLEGVMWISIGLSTFHCMLIIANLRSSFALMDLQIIYPRLKREFKKLVNFSTPSFMIGLTYGPPVWFCNSLLVRSENGLEQMAILGIALQWHALALFLPGALAGVILPVGSNLSETLSIEAFGKLVITWVTYCLFLALPVALMLASLSPFILSLYGPDFLNGSPVFVIIMLSSIFVSVQLIIGNILSARGKVWGQLVLNIMWAGVFIFFTERWINHGGFGLASSKLTATVLLLIGSIAYAYFLLGRKPGKGDS